MIYRVQRIIFLVFYTFSMAVISIPLVRLVTGWFPDHLYPLAVTLVLYMVLVVVVGSWIHTISYIPFHLSAAFDPVKNGVASGEIRGVEQLGRRITEFTTRFFDFAFLDISHAYIYTEETGSISHEELSEVLENIGKLELPKKDGDLERLTRAGKVTFDQREYHLYILPIWFGQRWLGYMGLLTPKRIGRIYRQFLEDFENQFLDDLLMLVIHPFK